MDDALTRPAGAADGLLSDGLLKVFALVRRDRETLRPEQRELLTEFDRAAAPACAPLLAAASLQDLDERLDHALVDAQDVIAVALRSALSTSSSFEELLLVDVDLPESFAEILGATPTERLRLGFRYAEVITGEILRDIANSSAEERAALRAFLLDLSATPLAIAYDASAPIEVRETFVNGTRASLAAIAALYAVSIGRRLEPWLALALADAFVAGEYAVLRFIASLPGATVPETIVAPADRFDLLALEVQHQAREERLAALYGAALASGEDPYSLDPEG